MTFLLEILEKIKESFQLSMTALQTLITNLEEQTKLIDEMSNHMGMIGKYSLNDFLGALRWIIGDPLWFVFYVLVLTGLAFTIYNIVMFIKTHALPGGVIDKVLGWFM